MHHKEYLSGGNSAKLLLSLLPDHTELFIFGKIGEMDRLEKELLSSPENSAIMWPSKEAVSVSELLSGKWRDFTSEEEQGRCDGSRATTPLFRFLVVDGTYNMARNMYKSIRKRLGVSRMPCTVRVDPSFASIFHRAQKNYGQAHRQDTGDVRRVSTAEACGLLLSEILGDSFLEMRITEAVHVNNRAVASSRGTIIDSD
jgi:DTW domain-containing protein YfiP